ncbi:MAG: hypothetical protein ACXVJ7_17455 [Acidimicrobiia bacterium]
MVRRTLAIVLLAVIVVGCGTETKKSVRTTHRSTSTTTSTTTTTRPRSAADDLAGYFGAAEATSHALAAAARKINEGVGRDRLSFDQATVDAIAAADPAPAAKLIPAGLDPTLMQAVLVTQSELTSRYFAMRLIRVGVFPTNESEGKEMLLCLGLGASPAARFAADLTSAKALAASSPEVTSVTPDSRPAAELAIRLQDILLRNSGCASCGGSVITELAPVVWAQQPSFAGDRPWDGTVGGVRFRATYAPASGWSVELNAC